MPVSVQQRRAIMAQIMPALPVLGKEEELLLWRRAKAGDQRAADKFTRHNLPLVIDLASGFRIPGYAPEDLYAVGMLGLARAIGKWNPERGAFSTVATIWIREALSHEYRTNKLGHGIAIPEARQADDAYPSLLQVCSMDDTVSLEGETRQRHELVPDTDPDPDVDAEGLLDFLDRRLDVKGRAYLRARMAGITENAFQAQRGIREDRRLKRYNRIIEKGMREWRQSDDPGSTQSNLTR